MKWDTRAGRGGRDSSPNRGQGQGPLGSRQLLLPRRPASSRWAAYVDKRARDSAKPSQGEKRAGEEEAVPR